MQFLAGQQERPKRERESVAILAQAASGSRPHPEKEEGLKTRGERERLSGEETWKLAKPFELNSEFVFLRNLELRALPANIGEIGDQRRPLAGGVRGSLSRTT